MQIDSNVNPDPMGKKRMQVLPQQYMGRFSAKSDFVKYFKEALQLYVPPDHM